MPRPATKTLRVHPTPQISSALTATLHNISLIGYLKLSIRHQNLAVADGMSNIATIHTEQDMAIAIITIHRCERIVIGNNYVGISSSLQNTQRLFEETSGYLGVILEEHGRNFGPDHARIAQIVLVDNVSYLVALQHVVGVSISA